MAEDNKRQADQNLNDLSTKFESANEKGALLDKQHTFASESKELP